MRSISENEKELILTLINPKLNEKTDNLTQLMTSHLNWNLVIGILISHRLCGIAWKKVYNNLILKGFNETTYPRFYKNLRDIYNVQFLRTTEQIKHTIEICREFDENDLRYCILKGFALSKGVYSDYGIKDSKDIDILVHRDDLKKAIQIIKSYGYIQGELNEINKDIIQTDRKDIVIRPMVSHEVIPLKKKINENPFIQTHDIDLHFSIDLMTSNKTDDKVMELLSRRIKINLEDYFIYSLSWEDHLIFLCEHFYKEATSDVEVKEYSDLSLYKLCDMAFMLSEPTININWDTLIKAVKGLLFQKAVYYSFHYVDCIFPGIVPSFVMKDLKPGNIEYLNDVYNYKRDELVISWTDNILERVFNTERAALIQK